MAYESLLKTIESRKPLRKLQIQQDKALTSDIQLKLAALGLYMGKVDGLWGRQTQRGANKFCIATQLNCHKSDIYTTLFFKKVDRTDTLKMPSTPSQHQHLIRLECGYQDVTDTRQIAYILATVQHECGIDFRPKDEVGGSRRSYASWFGRGYAQLTHKVNYEKYSIITGCDLLAFPDDANFPPLAAVILVHGMRTGAFTGAKLSDYIDGNKCDYVKARRIVNGNDRAELIAGYAKEWESRIQSRRA